MRALITVEVESSSAGSFPTPAEFREMFKVLGLQPADLPPKGPEEESDAYELRLKAQFQERASKILERIPNHSEEQKQKKELEREAIIYTSYLTKTDTDFMLTRRSDGSVRFRLLNSRIGNLQKACIDLVERIEEQFGADDKTKAQDSAKPRIACTINDVIEIYEHGLEEPTISGAIIRNKLAYVRERNALQVLVALATLTLFVGLLWMEGAVDPTRLRFIGFIARMQTAMLTACVVSLIEITYTLIRYVPPIEWSLTYKAAK